MAPDVDDSTMTLESLTAGFRQLYDQVQTSAQCVAYNAELLNAVVNRQNGFEAAIKILESVPSDIKSLAASAEDAQKKCVIVDNFGVQIESVVAAVAAAEVASDSRLRKEIEQTLTKVDIGFG